MWRYVLNIKCTMSRINVQRVTNSHTKNLIENIIIDIIDPLYCEPLYLLLYFECFLIISNLKINEFKKRNIVLNIKLFIFYWNRNKINFF